MSHWIVNMRIWLIMDSITDDVIRPKKSQHFELQ